MDAAGRGGGVLTETGDRSAIALALLGKRRWLCSEVGIRKEKREKREGICSDCSQCPAQAKNHEFGEVGKSGERNLSPRKTRGGGGGGGEGEKQKKPPGPHN
jgi:hypothetical protein